MTRITKGTVVQIRPGDGSTKAWNGMVGFATADQVGDDMIPIQFFPSDSDPQYYCREDMKIVGYLPDWDDAVPPPVPKRQSQGRSRSKGSAKSRSGK